MVRIGKIVTFTGSRETLTQKILDAISLSRPISPINWSFVKNNMMHIYGDSADLTALRTFLEGKGFTFTIGDDAPTEPTPEVETPPTADEIAASGFYKQAFNEEFDLMIAAIQSSIETRYDTLKGANPITFSEVSKVDIKHLRQRAN